MERSRRLFGIVGALMMVPLLGFGQSEEEAEARIARLSYVRGDVSVDRASGLGSEAGEVNLVLVEGDKLVTADGEAELQFGRRNCLRLDAGGTVEILSLPGEDRGKLKIRLLEGRMYIRVQDLSGEKETEVHAADASYYILEEGLYRFDGRTSGETEVSVFEGSLEAAGDEGSLLVEGRECLTASAGKFLSDPEPMDDRLDAFDRWNRERDDLLGRRTVSAHLPAAISEYEEELDNNGRWAYESPYGYVWVPYGLSADWRPYYFGRWVWYSVFGWTWIPSESWGWCTHHYGRWQWRFGLGWYWIPAAHWGPAWVHWFWDGFHVGWCPRSWHNRPVAVIGNRFHDWAYGADYPIHSRALTVIRRNELQSRDVFRHALGGRELDTLRKISLRAEQPAIRPAIAKSGLHAPAAPKSLSMPGIRNSETKIYSRMLREGSLAGNIRRSSGDKRSPISERPSSLTRNRDGRVSSRNTVRRSDSTPSSRSGSVARRYVRKDDSGGERGSRIYERKNEGASSGSIAARSEVKSSRDGTGYPSRLRGETIGRGRDDSVRSYGIYSRNDGAGSSFRRTVRTRSSSSYRSRRLEENSPSYSSPPTKYSFSGDFRLRSYQRSTSPPGASRFYNGSSFRTDSSPRISRTYSDRPTGSYRSSGSVGSRRSRASSSSSRGSGRLRRK